MHPAPDAEASVSIAGKLPMAIYSEVQRVKHGAVPVVPGLGSDDAQRIAVSQWRRLVFRGVDLCVNVDPVQQEGKSAEC